MGQSNTFAKHETLGLLYQFIGATSIGIGVYYAVWFAVRPLYFQGNIALSNLEWLFFPIFFGLGALLYSLGHIQLKEAKPKR